MTMDHQRLSMTVGAAMFTQRAIRRFRPDPIPTEDIRLVPDDAPRQSDGPPLRAPRDPQGRELPLLDPARLPARELRREPAPSHVGDDLPEPLGNGDAVGVRRSPVLVR